MRFDDWLLDIKSISIEEAYIKILHPVMRYKLKSRSENE
jgi:hypothetical protein